MNLGYDEFVIAIRKFAVLLRGALIGSQRALLTPVTVYQDGD
jgi:hypothetical protein